MQKVGVLGSCIVAKTPAKGFKQHSYDVRIGSRSADKVTPFANAAGISAGTFTQIADRADVVIVVKGTAAVDLLPLAGEDFDL